MGRAFWILCVLVATSLVIASCSSPFIRSGATSFAKDYLENEAKKKGIEIDAFAVREYNTLTVSPSDRMSGISDHVTFWMAYALRCPEGDWFDDWDYFSLARRNGKWEFAERPASVLPEWRRDTFDPCAKPTRPWDYFGP